MVPSKRRVTTAQAAEIVGISYDGLRSWLKRGLLRTTGPILPKFYSREAPAELTDSKRWQWHDFPFQDLCAFRLMRILTEAGLPWDTACSIAGENRFWWLQKYAQEEEEEEGSSGAITPFATILGIQKHPQSTASDTYYDCCLYTVDQLASDIRHQIVNVDLMVLVDLPRIRKDVSSRFEAMTASEGDGISASTSP